MAEPRWGFSLVKLLDGRAVASGGSGLDQLPNASDTVEAYDPVADAWSRLSSTAQPRCGASATVLQSGRILVAGGRSSEPTSELYDPATNSWKLTGPLPTARTGQTATLLEDGRVLI